MRDRTLEDWLDALGVTAAKAKSREFPARCVVEMTASTSSAERGGRPS